MRKVFIYTIAISILFVNAYSVYAQPRGNASPVRVSVNSNNQSQSITFPFKTRDLVINNMDSADYIFVDIINASNTNDRSKCHAIGPGDEFLLYDFITEGISILWDNGVYGTGEASPISVIATY